MKNQTPTVQQLIDVIAESNKAHDFALKMGALQPGKKVENPLLDSLYAAATRAAAALEHLMKVEVKIAPK